MGESPMSSSIDMHLQAGRELADYLFDDLRKNTWKDTGICRDAYGEGENYAHKLVAEVGERLNLIVDRDAAANTYMTLPGRDRDAPPIVIGSHLDSVSAGGNYDGLAGVVSGLAAIAILQSSGFRPRCDITVMGVRAEESMWFATSYFGSRAALGTLDPSTLDRLTRYDTGKTLADHVASSGGNPAALRNGEHHFVPKNIRAFMEVHIEQGPILETDSYPIGVVTGIRGNFRYPNARILGEYQHCGGMPRGHRKDAVVAAAMLVEALNSLWRKFEDEGVDMAFTVGKLWTDPNQHSMTKVPGIAEFSLDVRSLDPDVLHQLKNEVTKLISRISKDTGVKFEIGRVTNAPVGHMDQGIRDHLIAGAEKLGIKCRRIGSGASHDAAAFSAAGVPVGMIFIRNANGSHNPDEDMALEDFMEATRLLTWWLVETNHD